MFWLMIAVGLSIALNVWQWKRGLTAPLRGEVASYKKALDDSAGIAADNDASAKRLQAVADKTTAQLATGGAAYAKAMKESPLTELQCQPGQARMDATNLALGQSASPGEVK